MTHLFLRGRRREDFVQLEGHDPAFVAEVEESVVLRVEAQHGSGVHTVLLFLADGADAAKHTYVPWSAEGKR